MILSCYAPRGKEGKKEGNFATELLRKKGKERKGEGKHEGGERP